MKFIMLMNIKTPTILVLSILIFTREKLFLWFGEDIDQPACIHKSFIWTVDTAEMTILISVLHVADSILYLIGFSNTNQNTEI